VYVSTNGRGIIYGEPRHEHDADCERSHRRHRHGDLDHD
jgi:hypothetical protein